jgi:Trk-type K+ transport system membrane component
LDCLGSEQLLVAFSKGFETDSGLHMQYYIALPLTGFVIFGPYIRSQFEYVLSSDSQYRYVPPLWFSAFQAVSAFSNTGMSLVDLSMVPFQKAYPMIFVIVILIFAGNTAFPIL